MAISPEQWPRVEALFADLAARPAPDRDAALAALASEDPALAELVGRMVRAADSAPARISNAIGEAAGTVAEPASWAGRRFGPYEIVREIGRGGMGLVFEAVRADDEYRKRVALKIAPGWRGDASLHERFRAERQILAELESDTIARFFDGGTEDGIPYFVMELVDGEPITAYCDRLALPLEARLRLFQQVCAAVAFAHERLVVHRDLKPANILVTAHGTPKLVDFGIAKVLDPARDPAMTVTGAPAWTPDYVSPEQVRGKAITARTDVYALGLVLYELVSGERGQQADTTSLLALDRSVCDVEPRRPSERLLAGGARARAREVAGDLDVVVLTAIRKDPNERYASAAALSADIGRVLEHRPILARQVTAWQRARKFARRHRAGVAAAAVMVAIAAAGYVSTVLQARRAERRFQQVRALANTFVFDVHDRIAGLPGATEARHAIVTTALSYLESLRADAGGDPALSREIAAAYEKVGSVQGLPTVSNLGDTNGALRSFELGRSILQPLADDGDAEAQFQLASTELKTAVVRRARGDKDAAAAGFARAYDQGHALLAKAPRDPRLLELVGGIDSDRSRAAFELRDYAAAEREAAEAMELGARLVALAPGNRAYRDGLASANNSLGAVLIAAGKLEEAAARFRESASIREQLVREAPDSADYKRALAISYGSLGDVLGYRPGENLGDTAGAVEAYSKAAALAQNARERDPKDRRALYDLANVHLRIGTMLIEADPPRFEDGLREVQAADASTRALLTQDPGVAQYQYLSFVIRRRLGEALDGLGRAPEAIAMLEEARPLSAKLASGPNGPAVRQVMVYVSARLGALRARAGAVDRALAETEAAASSLREKSIGVPIVDAGAHTLIARAYSAAAAKVGGARRSALAEQAHAHFDDSLRLWKTAPLPPAFESRRASAMAVLTRERDAAR